MSKVTSKLQVTLPKALARQYGIRPGDEIEWHAAGDALRVVPSSREAPLSPADRLRRFDRTTQRLRRRKRKRVETSRGDRGWTREELYERGRAR